MFDIPYCRVAYALYLLILPVTNKTNNLDDILHNHNEFFDEHTSWLLPRLSLLTNGLKVSLESKNISTFSFML